jgi:hypothetical protein
VTAAPRSSLWGMGMGWNNNIMGYLLWDAAVRAVLPRLIFVFAFLEDCSRKTSQSTPTPREFVVVAKKPYYYTRIFLSLSLYPHYQCDNLDP